MTEAKVPKDQTQLGITFVDVTDPVAVAELTRQLVKQFSGRFTMEPITGETRNMPGGKIIGLSRRSAETQATI